MEAIRYAVYVLNARRRRCVIASQPSTNRTVVAATKAAQRQGAYVVPGMEFPSTLTLEEVSRRTGLDIPGLIPTSTD
ncbi:MAG: hypothetical protein Q8R35_00350 [bacterium]|nr:hypothetical protein [bacterium]